MKISFTIVFLLGYVFLAATAEDEALQAPGEVVQKSTKIQKKAPKVDLDSEFQFDLDNLDAESTDRLRCALVKASFYKKNQNIFRAFQQRYAKLIAEFRKLSDDVAKAYKVQRSKVCKGKWNSAESWKFVPGFTDKELASVSKKHHQQVKKGAKKQQVKKSQNNVKVVHHQKKTNGGKKQKTQNTKKAQKKSAKGQHSNKLGKNKKHAGKKVVKQAKKKQQQQSSVDIHKNVNKKKIDALKVDDELKKELKDLVKEADQIKPTGEDKKVEVAIKTTQSEGTEAEKPKVTVIAQKQQKNVADGHAEINKALIGALNVDGALKKELQELAKDADKLKPKGNDEKVKVEVKVTEAKEVSGSEEEPYADINPGKPVKAKVNTEQQNLVEEEPANSPPVAKALDDELKEIAETFLYADKKKLL